MQLQALCTEKIEVSVKGTKACSRQLQCAKSSDVMDSIVGNTAFEAPWAEPLNLGIMREEKFSPTF
jgi:hypothetical protein